MLLIFTDSGLRQDSLYRWFQERSLLSRNELKDVGVLLTSVCKRQIQHSASLPSEIN